MRVAARGARDRRCACVRAAAAICAPVIRTPAGTADEPDRERFSTSVITNSVMPTAKIVSYSIEPVGDVAARRAPRCRRPSTGSTRAGRAPRFGVLAAGDEDDHRLADGARGAEHERRDDARQRGREDDPQRRPAACWRRGRTRPRAATRAPRHGVLGDRGDRRQHEQAEDDAGGQRVELVDPEPEDVAEDLGREEGEREVAEDDRRDAGEHLEHRLDDLAHARAARTRQVDRRTAARAGWRPRAPIRGQVERAPDQREHAEGLLVAAELRRPLRAEQEVADRRRRRRRRSSRSAARRRSASVVSDRQAAAAKSSDLDARLEARTHAWGVRTRLVRPPSRSGGGCGAVQPCASSTSRPRRSRACLGLRAPARR